MQDRTYRWLILVIPLAGISAPLKAEGLTPWTSTPLRSIQWFDEAPTLPPLSSPLLFSRKTGAQVCPNCTTEIMSLIYEQSAADVPVHSWPFYVQLDTLSNDGSATGTYARIYSRGAGWTAAHHGEAIASAPGSTNIGFNAELSPMVPGARMVGINLQAKSGYAGVWPSRWSNEAVNIQNDDSVGWITGIKFDHTRTTTGLDFSPDSSGERAIHIQGKYGIGLDMGSNNIRLNTGARVCFDDSDQICMRYNPRKNRLEIINGSGVLGYFNANGTKAANRCLNC